MSVYRLAATCAPPPLPPYALDHVKSTATCRFTYEVHEVGAIYTGPLFRKCPTTCTEVTLTSSILYRLGAPVAAGDLATAAIVTEP